MYLLIGEDEYPLARKVIAVSKNKKDLEDYAPFAKKEEGFIKMIIEEVEELSEENHDEEKQQSDNLRKEIKDLRQIMDVVASNLETEESTPSREAERLRGTLAGFQPPKIDLSFLEDHKHEDEGILVAELNQCDQCGDLTEEKNLIKDLLICNNCLSGISYG